MSRDSARNAAYPSVNATLDLIDKFGKLALVIAAIIYAIGFTVVTLHLSSFGITSTGLARASYILTGLWVIFPIVLFCVFVILVLVYYGDSASNEAFRFDLRNLYKRFKRLLVATLQALFVALLFLGLCAGFLGLVPLAEIVNSLGPAEAKSLLGSMILMLLNLIIVVEVVRKARGEGELGRIFLSSAFFLLFSAAAFLQYLSIFSRQIYPVLPASLGGGKPLSVQLVLSDAFAARVASVGLLEFQDATSTTVAYELIIETDENYILKSMGKPASTIGLRKELVDALAIQ